MPRRCSAPIRLKRLLSYTQPGASGSPRLAISSPVENNATRRRRLAVTAAMPSDAISPRSAGRSTRPARSTGLPRVRSSPWRLRFSPALITRGAMRTRSPSPRGSTSHNSSGTTVSAPSGITAPVMMRTHSPAPDRPRCGVPANTVADGSQLDRRVCAQRRRQRRHNRPSPSCRAPARRSANDHVGASTRPSACANGTLLALVDRPQARRDRRAACGHAQVVFARGEW